MIETIKKVHLIIIKKADFNKCVSHRCSKLTQQKIDENALYNVKIGFPPDILLTYLAQIQSHPLSTSDNVDVNVILCS